MGTRWSHCNVRMLLLLLWAIVPGPLQNKNGLSFFSSFISSPPSPPSFDWFSVMNAQIGEALVVANLIMVFLHSIFLSLSLSLSLSLFFFYTASFVFMLSSKHDRAPLIKLVFLFTWSIKYCRSVVGSALGSSLISVWLRWNPFRFVCSLVDQAISLYDLF